MPTNSLSILSWNIEHFKKPKGVTGLVDYQARVNRVTQLLISLDPDVIALYEIEGKEAFEHLRSALTAYQFHITEGPQVQEILVAVKGGLSAFFTQKLEFKSGSSYLRPGALLTVRKGNTDFPILFLHTKSGNDPKGFGLRDDMLTRAIKFRKVLDKASQDPLGANYLFMGDLNTMGMDYPYERNISFELELKRADSRAKRYYRLKRLTKSFDFTYFNGNSSSIPKSNLDHVYAAKHLEFIQQKGADVLVKGWVDFDQATDQDQWIKDFSDHALLYMEIRLQ